MCFEYDNSRVWYGYYDMENPEHRFFVGMKAFAVNQENKITGRFRSNTSYHFRRCANGNVIVSAPMCKHYCKAKFGGCEFIFEMPNMGCYIDPICVMETQFVPCGSKIGEEAILSLPINKMSEASRFKVLPNPLDRIDLNEFIFPTDLSIIVVPVICHTHNILACDDRTINVSQFMVPTSEWLFDELTGFDHYIYNALIWAIRKVTDFNREDMTDKDWNDSIIKPLFVFMKRELDYFHKVLARGNQLIDTDSLDEETSAELWRINAEKQAGLKGFEL